nr:MAG TPA: hypothetical protein [Caudoviricetes sp.]
MIINKTKPANWQGVHVLKCKHCVGSKNCKRYAMYCDVIKEMPDGRVKIKVYGDRYWHTNNFKYRYVEKRKISKYEEYFKD